MVPCADKLVRVAVEGRKRVCFVSDCVGQMSEKITPEGEWNTFCIKHSVCQQHVADVVAIRLMRENWCLLVSSNHTTGLFSVLERRSSPHFRALRRLGNLRRKQRHRTTQRRRHRDRKTSETTERLQTQGTGRTLQNPTSLNFELSGTKVFVWTLKREAKFL